MIPPRLSLCIATFNRAAFLAEMLDSIIKQVTDECEIVVSDNASTDDTEEVVATISRRFDRVRYVRQSTNEGIDRNFNHAVEVASGEYCWLLPDDDVLKPNAISTVLSAIPADPSLIVVNVDFMDFTLSQLIQRGINFQEDRIYAPDDIDQLFLDADHLNGYIGSFIIKRSIWLERNRARYFGSDFVHLGVIYQARFPSRVLMIAQSLVSMRMGNAHEWWPRLFHQCMNSRSLMASLALSDAIKNSRAELWDSPAILLWLRAVGAYSLLEYREHIRPRLRSVRQKLAPLLIVLLPAALAHSLFVSYLRVTRRTWMGRPPQWLLQVLSESRVQRKDRAESPSA